MKVPVTNETATFMHVGGVTIPPSETREVEETHLPDYKAEEAAPAPVEDHLAALLELSVPKIKDALPNLNDLDVERLGELEQAKGDKARTSLLGLIAETIMDRAAMSFETEIKAALELPIEELLTQIPTYATAVLQRVLQAEQAKGDEANADLVQALEAELLKDERKA